VRHLDPDRLALLGLAEPPTDAAESDHVDACPDCRAEVDALREVAALGARTQEVRDLPAPPARVWHGILAGIGAVPHAPPGPPLSRPPLSGPLSGPPLSGPPLSGPLSKRAALYSATRQQGTPPGEKRTLHAPGAPGSRPARSTRLRPALVAAVAAVLAVTGTLVVTGRPDRAPVTAVTTPAVTARATLARLPTAPASVAGDARVLAGDGGERLHLHVTGLPLSTGYYEVWLINPTNDQMISVGTLGGSADALLPLPGTVDLNAYRIVDVSAEAYDGRTAHSGQSLLRGALTG
jgi:hypothetical protein